MGNQFPSLRYSCLAAFILGALTLALGTSADQSNKLTISTEEQIAQDIAQVPCKNSERLNAVKLLFTKMGAQAEDVRTEKNDGIENVVVRKQGQDQGTIVIGAHYDKTPDGCGAIDNWTGIVAIAHIYRSLKDVRSQKTLIFVAFGEEELGLRGSKAMVRVIKKEEVSQYCAMVNIDSLGMAAPQVLSNASSDKLTDRVADLAKRMNMPFQKVSIMEAGADSMTFMEKKIPAVTISALGSGWNKVLHTSNDQVAKVNMTSVYLGYRLALALVAELDQLACEASRQGTKTK